MLLARERRKLAAIVAADVVGYSRLMGRDESGTLAHLRKNRAERLENRHDPEQREALRSALLQAKAKEVADGG
jgi:hypothetical protein